MRSGLAAAFARARELGVSAQELEALVSPHAGNAGNAGKAGKAGNAADVTSAVSD
jgi:hypothetical protein